MNIYFGVVEDRYDPLMLGRLRVRWVGLHTLNKSTLPTKELPWATPLQPIQSSAMNGIGSTPMGPVEGTHVAGFFRDNFFQDAIVLGTISGIPQEESNPQVGFNDPNGIYPKKEFLKEPDTNRISRGSTGTILDSLQDGLTFVVANTEEKFLDSPFSNKVYQYPFVHVNQDENGNIVNLVNNSTGSNSMSRIHSSGKAYEIFDSDGSVYNKSYNSYDDTSGNKYIITDQDCIISVLQNRNDYIEHKFDIQVKDGYLNIVINSGDLKVDVQNGNVQATVKGNMQYDVDGDVKQNIKGNLIQKVEGRSVLVAGSDCIIRAGAVFINN